MTRDQALAAGGLLAAAVLILTRMPPKRVQGGYDPGQTMNTRLVRSKVNPDYLATGRDVTPGGSGTRVAAPPDQLLHPLQLEACLMAPHPLYGGHRDRMSPEMCEVQSRGWASWIYAPPSEQSM